jgi:hypothetical protein
VCQIKSSDLDSSRDFEAFARAISLIKVQCA